jgi:hypothetical protein
MLLPVGVCMTAAYLWFAAQVGVTEMDVRFLLRPIDTPSCESHARTRSAPAHHAANETNLHDILIFSEYQTTFHGLPAATTGLIHTKSGPAYGWCPSSRAECTGGLWPKATV